MIIKLDDLGNGVRLVTVKKNTLMQRMFETSAQRPYSTELYIRGQRHNGLFAVAADEQEALINHQRMRQEFTENHEWCMEVLRGER